MAKLSRPLSGVGGRFYYAWHMRTMVAHFSQQSPPKSLLSTRPLLAPGTEPAGLFVPVRPLAELWVVSLPTRQVDDLLKAVDLPYDQVQLLQGPSGRSDTQWALLPGVSEERRAEVQQRFYTQPYAAFVPYGVYKGHPNEASTVVEAWLKKKKRTAGAMGSLWRTVDFRCKALVDRFSVLPDVQWDAPAKLRVALWTPGDAALFILKIVPQLLSARFSLTDERTGAWIDEREVKSVQSGSSTYSVTGAAMRGQPNGAAQPIVLVDMPDHLLKQDVEAVVRRAMLAKSVVGSADALLVAKKLDWTMGNVKLPSWQVSGPANMAGGLLGAMLDISVPGPHGGVQHSMKEYTSARASWRKDRVGKPPPPQASTKETAGQRGGGD